MPLQGPHASIWQIHICVTLLVLLVLLVVPDTEPEEYGCALTVNADIDNESRLGATIENKKIKI